MDRPRSPSAAPAPAPADRPLPIHGFQGTPDQIEQQWYEQVYLGQGDSMAQLTWRALAMGTLLGGVLSMTNIYLGLKSGWAFGVTITACIASFSLWSVLLRTGLAKTPMTILENNCMQSTASAAGYSTGSVLYCGFGAYMVINDRTLPLGLTIAWVFFIAVLGVTMAIPMKRQMINVEQLRFPTGIATAETLRALYSKGERARQSARALSWAALAAAASQFWNDGLHLVSARLEPYGLGPLVERLNHAVFGTDWTRRTVQFVWDPVFIAAGVLMGLRPAASILLGGTLCWCVWVPYLQHHGYITGTSYRDLVQWTLWGGASCMVVSGLLALALQWRTVTRALRGLRSLLGGPAAAPTPLDAIETPASWFVLGQAVALVALAWLAKVTFDIPVWQSVIAVLLAFLLALVASRVTGETDTTPMGAMGKIPQLVFGALSPGNTTVNLMSANITAGSAMAAADLLTDLKSGYLLGANPRKQFLAQFSGIFIGSIATVLTFMVLVPTPSALGSDQFPAPSVQTWRAVALALSHGFGSLETPKLWTIAVGSLLGALLTVLPRRWPGLGKWLPSAAGFGLAWTFHWYYGMLFFTGAVLGWAMEKRDPQRAELYNFPLAAGVMAGGSLMGVILVFWENGPAALHQLLGTP